MKIPKITILPPMLTTLDYSNNPSIDPICCLINLTTIKSDRPLMLLVLPRAMFWS